MAEFIDRSRSRINLNSPRVALLIVGLIALLFGLINLGNTGFYADEYNSLREFTQPGYHPHSIPFFAIMRAWGSIGGHSLEWLRLLSALFSVGVALVTYLIGFEATRDRIAAFGMGLLAATSAWRVEEGQVIRFYAYFMFAAGLFMWAILRLARAHHTLDRLFVLGTALLVATSHLLGTVFVFAGLVFGLNWINRRARWILLVALCAMSIVLTVRPSLVPRPIMQAGYTALGTYQGGNDVSGGYVGPRGASLGTLIKPAYAGYVYLLGTSIYPFDFAVSLSALLFISLGLILGWRRLGQRSSLNLLLLAWIVVPIFLVFFALDSLAPPGYTPPAAHHVAPIAIALWIILGLLASERRYRFIFGAIIVVNLISLLYYYTSDWSLDARQDLNVLAAVAQARSAGCGPDAMLIPDGRMAATADTYLTTGCRLQSILGVSPAVLTTPQVALWYTALTSNSATAVPAAQQALGASGYRLQDRWEYKLDVIETYRLKAAVQLADGQFALPWSVPPQYFSSLRLPVSPLTVSSTQVLGAVVMKPGSMSDWSIALSPPIDMSGLELTSSTFQMPDEFVGTLEATFEDGQVLSTAIYNNQQTADWSATQCSQCAVAFSWRKRLDVLGRAAYPGAWQDFSASGFTSQWLWDTPRRVTALTFKRAATAGEWWIWQVVPTSHSTRYFQP